MTFQTKFTQQDDRKKRTAKHLCGTDVTGQSLVCFVVIFNSHQCFLVLCQKICLKESEVWRKVVSNKIIVTLDAQSLPILQKRVIRTIAKTTFNAHTDPIFQNLGILKFHDI